MTNEDRWLPWILVAVLIVVMLIVYGRANTTEQRLRNEIQAIQACVENHAYTRDMIEGQCLADYADMKASK